MVLLQQEMDAVKAKREGFESQAAKESQRLQATQLSKVKQEFDAFRHPPHTHPLKSALLICSAISPKPERSWSWSAHGQSTATQLPLDATFFLP